MRETPGRPPCNLHQDPVKGRATSFCIQIQLVIKAMQKLKSVADITRGRKCHVGLRLEIDPRTETMATHNPGAADRRVN